MHPVHYLVSRMDYGRAHTGVNTLYPVAILNPEPKLVIMYKKFKETELSLTQLR